MSDKNDKVTCKLLYHFIMYIILYCNYWGNWKMNVLTKVKEQVLKFYKSLYDNLTVENFDLCPYTSLIVIDNVKRFLVSVDYIEKLIPCKPSMFDLRLIITCDGKIIEQLIHTDMMFNLFKYVSNIHLTLSSKLEGLNNEVRRYTSIGNFR